MARLHHRRRRQDGPKVSEWTAPSLGSHRAAFPQDAQPASTPATVQPVGPASQQGRNAGLAAVVGDQVVGLHSCLPGGCCRSPALTSAVPRPMRPMPGWWWGEASGIKACFSRTEASFAYDTTTCCLLDGESQLDRSLPTVPGKMEQNPSHSPPPPSSGSFSLPVSGSYSSAGQRHSPVKILVTENTGKHGVRRMVPGTDNWP